MYQQLSVGKKAAVLSSGPQQGGYSCIASSLAHVGVDIVSSPQDGHIIALREVGAAGKEIQARAAVVLLIHVLLEPSQLLYLCTAGMSGSRQGLEKSEHPDHFIKFDDGICDRGWPHGWNASRPPTGVMLAGPPEHSEQCSSFYMKIERCPSHRSDFPKQMAEQNDPGLGHSSQFSSKH